MANPYFEIEKAIVTKLKASSSWLWPIYTAVPESEGPLFVYLSQVSSSDASAKRGEIWEIIISFDAWDARSTTETGTNEDITNILYIIDRVLTLDNQGTGFTALTLGGGFLDVSHQPVSGPDIVPNIDQGIRHGNRKIKFTIAI